MKGRKAMSMPMEIIIAVVVLVVIALAVIMMTTGSITNFGTENTKTGTNTANSIQCKAEAIKWCNDNPGQAKCTSGCPSCGSAGASCGSTSTTSSSTTSTQRSTSGLGADPCGGLPPPC